MVQSPAPAPVEETMASKGGATIFLRSWLPASAPRAVIVLCHGVNAHGGQNPWAGEQFVNAGLATYALDLRGRGKSSGKRFYVDSIDDYVADLGGVIALAKSRHPGLPVFLLGHSAGGVTAVSYALDNQKELAGLICESFAYKVPAPGFALTVIKWLGGVTPNLPVLKLKMKDFTRDPVALAKLEADPLTLNEAQPAKTVAALVRATERMAKEFPKITLPVFILHGTVDKATVPAGSQEFYDKAGSKDKTLKLYEGHFHDLLNDIGKEGVMADVQAWIDKHIAG